MQVVPLQPIPNQTLQSQLDGQPVTLTVYQNAYGLFVDAYLNNVLIAGGVIGLNLVKLIRTVAGDFSGDFVFFDTQGLENPIYTGLGSRYFLVYFTAEELAEV